MTYDFGVSRPTVSRQLKKLKDARTCGYYRVEPSVLTAMSQLLTQAAGA